MVVILYQKTRFNLRNIIAFIITPYPLLISRCNGAPLKTEKAALFKKLDSLQNPLSSCEEASCDCVYLYDGG